LIGDPDSPEEWGRLAEAAKVAKKKAGICEKLAKQHAQDGGDVAGFALQSTGSTTKINAGVAVELAGRDMERLLALLDNATIKAAAAKECEWLGPAVTLVPKAPALVRSKRKDGSLAGSR
jgi:hypothetical protein